MFMPLRAHRRRCRLLLPRCPPLSTPVRQTTRAGLYLPETRAPRYRAIIRYIRQKIFNIRLLRPRSEPIPSSLRPLCLPLLLFASFFPIYVDGIQPVLRVPWYHMPIELPSGLRWFVYVPGRQSATRKGHVTPRHEQRCRSNSYLTVEPSYRRTETR